MKTIKLQNIEVEEITIRPNEQIPISVSYKIFDDTGTLLTVRRVQVERSDAPTQINNIANKLLQHIIGKEGI